MLKTKEKIIIIISILLMISAIAVLVSFNSGTKEVKDNKPVEQKEPKQTTKETSMELLNYLINSTEYQTISNNDKSFYNKYKSLELIIYNSNVYSYKKLSNDEIISSVFNNLEESNIKNVEKKDNNIYGFVPKSYVEKQKKDLYNDEIKLKIGENIVNKYNYNFVNIANKVYRYVYLVELKGENYKIKIVDNYGTYAAPRIYPFPMRIINAKKIDDYILVTSKAVHLVGTTQNNDKWTMKVCNNLKKDTTNICDKEIGEEIVDKGPFATIDIDKYLEEASTIYTIFKEEEGNYYFYKNFINNE